MLNNFVLLTGSTGYLGSNILKMLIGNGYKVIILIRSASSLERIKALEKNCIVYNLDETDLKSIFNNYRIKTVINTAACYGRSDETITEIINSNVVFPLSLLELSIKYNVESFINTDSSLDANLNEYSLSKSQFRAWLSFYQYKICVRNVILEYFYGPFDSDWKFVTMTLKKFVSRSAEFNLTSGEQVRRFIYIDDVVEAFRLLLLEKPQRALLEYHLGGTAIKIKDLVYMCKSISSNQATKLNFGVLSDRAGETFKEEVDTTLINKTGWNPKIDLEQGLKLTFNSLQQRPIA